MTDNMRILIAQRREAASKLESAIGAAKNAERRLSRAREHCDALTRELNAAQNSPYGGFFSNSVLELARETAESLATETARATKSIPTD